MNIATNILVLIKGGVFRYQLKDCQLSSKDLVA